MESGSGERVPGTQLSRACSPGPGQPPAPHPNSLFFLSPVSWEVGVRPSWERRSAQAAQGTLPALPKASLLEDHAPSIHTATLASGRPPGGRGQAAGPLGASVSPSAIFCAKLNQIMRASPQNTIWRAVRHLTQGALIYYCLLSVRSSLRLSLLCQWFQMPRNHPGSFVEDTG